MASLTVKEFIEEFRLDVGDETHTYPVKNIISWLNTALREFAGLPLVNTLFLFSDTIGLDELTESGEKSTMWKLDDDKIGNIMTIRSLSIIGSRKCRECRLDFIFMPLDAFNGTRYGKSCNPCKTCGCCCKEVYTIMKNYDGTFLKTSTPLPPNSILNLTYTFMPRRFTVKDLNEKIPMNDIGLNLLMAMVRVRMHRYNVDDVRALAEYENIDKEIYELKQNLAANTSDYAIKRSW